MMFAGKNNTPQRSGARLGVYPVGTAFHKDGAEIQGIGVNHWGVFQNELTSFGIGGDYITDLTAIRNTWGLPFVRISFGMYSRTTWVADYHSDKATFFSKLDDLVAKCEALGLGIVAALTWDLRSFTDACYDVSGIFCPPRDLAYPETIAWREFEDYVSTVVDRYKNSPAIWAWEVANEPANSIGSEYYQTWKLDGTGTDGGGTPLTWLDWGAKPTGGAYDWWHKMSFDEWGAFSTRFVNLINRIDPHQRLILSGNPIGNAFAVKAQTTDTVGADTLAEWDGIAGTDNLPWIAYRDKAFNAVTMHIYPQSTSNSTFFSGAEKTHAEMIALCKGWCDTAGKPFFLEEFGATYYVDTSDQTSNDLATETANFDAAMTAIQSNGIKLAAVWNYGGDLAGSEAWMKWKLADPERTYQLEAIATYNAGL